MVVATLTIPVEAHDPRNLHECCTGDGPRWLGFIVVQYDSNVGREEPL